MRKRPKRKAIQKPEEEEEAKAQPVSTSRDKRVNASKSNTHNLGKGQSGRVRVNNSLVRTFNGSEMFLREVLIIKDEDLWKAVFLVGTEWDQLDTVYQYNWNFSNLEDAFEGGGKLFNKKVYLFGCTEAITDSSRGDKVILIPVLVAVVSPFPPSHKIGITSVQRESKDIVAMKQMKMDWVPYIPPEKRDRQVERMKCQIYTLSCTQRRAALRHLQLDRLMEYQYCIPYFYQPFAEDELEQSTVVDILFPAEPTPVYCQFDWEFDEVEEFTNERIENEELSEDQKDAFKEFVREEVRKAKRANREAREARKRAIEEMSEETKAAFENMRFYKFYPVQTPDTPDISKFKNQHFINRYYGKAHEIL